MATRTAAGTVLLGLLAGLALLDRPFGVVGIPGTPVYLTEVVLVVGLVAVCSRRGVAGRLFATTSIAPVLVVSYFAWGFIRLLGSLNKPVIVALRDSALTYYALFAFVAFTLCKIDDRFSAEGLLRVYGRLVPVLLVLAPIRLVFSSVVKSLSELPPTIPGSDVTLLGGHRPGNLGVHVALATVYLASSGRRDRATTFWVVWGVLTLVLIATQNRGGLMASIAVFGVAWLFWRRAIRFRGRPVVGVLLAAIVIAWGLNLQVSEGERALSVDQLLSNVTSLVGVKPEKQGSNLGDTVDFRVELWTKVYKATVQKGYLANGWGFGDNLGASFLPTHEDRTLRNPHNSHMTVLARLGIVGLVLWLALLSSWFKGVKNLARPRGRKPWDDARARLAMLLAAGVSGVAVNAFFDPTLETPMVAVWFWILIGLGLALITAPRTAWESEL